MTGPVLQVEGLRVELDAGAHPVVDDVAFSLAPGEVLGLVGESGSGKTTTALAALGFVRPGARISAGAVTVAGEPVLGIPEADVRRLRGRLVSYVPQQPASSLNPAIRIGDWVEIVARAHCPDDDLETVVVDAFERVGLPSTRSFRRRYVHQISGGQAQRVAIATAFVSRPPVVILDEPTTGLDVVTQATILREIARLQADSGVAMLYVSHDLSVVGTVADRIAVMYGGRIVEQGPAAEILRTPRHPYARGLIASVPDHAQPRRLVAMPGVAAGVGGRTAGCAFAPRCPARVARCSRDEPPVEPAGEGREVRCFEWRRSAPMWTVEEPHAAAPRDDDRPLLSVESLRASYPGSGAVAVADVSFTVVPGESLALVGESGSGKTTIARCVAGLHEPDAGRLLLDGAPLAASARQRSLADRRRVQLVFQNPDASLNPDHRVAQAIARPLRLLRGQGRREAEKETARLLELVRLPAGLARRYPRELSGGERQRVALARALAAEPELVICDEVTSALDVSVQAAVLEVLADLRSELGLALLFITHDLGVVGAIADRVLVLKDGELREEGAARAVLAAPADTYTRLLVESAPRLP